MERAGEIDRTFGGIVAIRLSVLQMKNYCGVFCLVFLAAVNILQDCYGNFRILHMQQANLHLLVSTGFKVVRGTDWLLQRILPERVCT